jgi:hypothetical protein
VKVPETAFVSMPFGDDPESPENDWTKLYEHGIKSLEAKIPDQKSYEPIVLFRADRTLNSLGLKSNVKGLIEQSTIVIAVLTTTSMSTKEGVGIRLSNPNVLWELGYAEALGKPIVALADNESLRAMPLLAGVPNVCVYNHELVRAAKSKDAAIALAKIARDLAPFVTKACDDARRGQSGQARTRATAYASRDDVQLPKIVSGADHHVDILTTNVNYFLTGTFQDGEKHPFVSALKNGAAVRIVTMDPESVIAEYRARQLGRGDDIPGYRRELREGIIQLYERFGAQDNFYLHIYNDLPLQITIRIDETVITSVVTRGDRARKRIQVQFNLHDDGVTESFVSHFQSMFEDSKDIRGVAWVLRHAVGRREDAIEVTPEPPRASIKTSSSGPARKRRRS